MALNERLEKLGQVLAERERDLSSDMDRAFGYAHKLHDRLASALDVFHAQVMEDAPQLALTLSEVEVDEKHLHSVQFQLERGRHRAVFIVKSRGEVTFVGPFRAGKTEGPCRSFSFNSADEIEKALEDFVVAFVDQAATP